VFAGVNRKGGQSVRGLLPQFLFRAGHPGGNGNAGDDHQPTTFY